MNEEKVEAAKHLSDKIEIATRFNLYRHNLDSENYQVTFFYKPIQAYEAHLCSQYIFSFCHPAGLPPCPVYMLALLDKLWAFQQKYLSQELLSNVSNHDHGILCVIFTLLDRSFIWLGTLLLIFARLARFA
jgi:hypothetical protein